MASHRSEFYDETSDFETESANDRFEFKLPVQFEFRPVRAH